MMARTSSFHLSEKCQEGWGVEHSTVVFLETQERLGAVMGGLVEVSRMLHIHSHSFVDRLQDLGIRGKLSNGQPLAM